MRITVDCQAIQSNNSLNRGIGNYSEDFLTHILTTELKLEITLMVNIRLPRSKVDELVKLCHPGNKLEIREWMPLSNCRWISGEKIRREISERIYSEVLISTKPDDFVLLSAFEGLSEDACWVLPPGIDGTVIFYDAIPKIFEEKYLSSMEVNEWYSLTATRLSGFHRVLAISESASADATNYLDLANQKVQVIHFGVQDRFFDFEESYSAENYVLAVLGEDERKNKINLLLAWKRLKYSAPDLKLKIVYKQSPPEKINNERFLQENELKNYVEFLGYVETHELDKLYQNCLFSIFPSFYEGLGLPVLESFAHFKPCIVSSTSSLLELVSSNELVFDPNLPSEIEQKVLGLMRDKELYSKAQQSGRDTLTRYRPENKQKQVKDLFSRRAEGSKSQNIFQEIPRLHVNFYTVLPPVPSGIANYAANLIHELHINSELTLISNFDPILGYECPECGISLDIRDRTSHEGKWIDGDIDIHNIGNSEHHVWQIELVKNYPGLIIMHDGYLSGLVWSMHVANSNIGGFFQQGILESSSLSFIDSNYFDEPHKMIINEKLNQFFLESSTSVIVHTQEARKMIENDFALIDSSQIRVIPHFARVDHPKYENIKRRKIVGVFGIIAETKMYREIIEAWEKSEIGGSGEFQLKFVGEDLSDDFSTLVRNENKKVRITCTGYLSDEEYSLQFDDISFAIQLRREFRGESSGAITELLARGIPVITNIEAWISDFKDAKELLIHKDFGTSDLAQKIDLVNVGLERYVANSRDIRSDLEKSASPAQCVASILNFALTSSNSNATRPLSHLKSIDRFFPNFLEKGLGDRDLAESCIRSFPLQFSKKRIFVAVKDEIESRDPVMIAKASALSEQIKEYTGVQIVFCRNLKSQGYIDTCNFLFVNSLYINLNLKIDHKTWLRKGDIFVNLTNYHDKLYSEISIVDLVFREFGEYLA